MESMLISSHSEHKSILPSVPALPHNHDQPYSTRSTYCPANLTATPAFCELNLNPQDAAQRCLAWNIAKPAGVPS